MNSHTAAEGGRPAPPGGSPPASNPLFLAFPAIRPGLVSTGPVGIRPLTVEGRVASDAVRITFTGVDLNTWAARFLRDLDRFVDQTVDGPILRRLREHHRLRGPGLRNLDFIADGLPASAVTLALESRDRIADVLAGTLQSILDVPTASADSGSLRHPNIAAAREDLRHRLAFSFGPFLKTCLVVQDAQPPDATSGYRVTVIHEPERHRTVSVDLPWRVAAIPNRPTRVRVPVPLRSTPLTPRLLGQLVLASHPDSRRLEESALWTYGLMVSHLLMPQDQLELGIDINSPYSSAKMDAHSDDAPLAAALAQYHSVAEALWTLLDRTDTDTDPSIDEAPVQTFVELTLGIAEAWEQDVTWPRRFSWNPTEPKFQYAVRLCLPEDQIDPTTPGITCLEVRALDPTQPNDLGWPQIRLTSGDGVRMTLERETVSPSAALYRPAQDGRWPRNGLLEFEFIWAHLNLASHQSAQGRIRVVRNVDLLQTCTGQIGPTGPSTHPDFVSTTGTVATPSPVISQILPSCILPLEGPDLGTALEAAIALLFGKDPLPSQATVSVSHGSSLPGDLSIDIVQPVNMAPGIPLKDVPEACARLVQNWTSQAGSPAPGGRWLVRLTVFSSLADPNPLPIYSATFRYPDTTVEAA